MSTYVSLSDDERHKRWLAELKKAQKKPRVLIKGPAGEDCMENCVMCGKITTSWLMPENAPLCSGSNCLAAYVKNPSVYDPRGLYPKQVKAPPPDEPVVDNLAAGLEVVKRLLHTMRDAAQGGYTSYRGDGQWSFAATSLPMVTPDELNTLFAMVGVKPDVVESKGNCNTCMFARPDGRDRGWDSPCSGCSRPVMSNYIPKRGLKVTK